MIKPYPLQVIDFTKAVIRHRNRLLNSNKSDINQMKAESYIEALNRNLHEDFSNKGAANYFILFNSQIRYLIKHDDFKKLNKFNEIEMRSGAFSKL